MIEYLLDTPPNVVAFEGARLQPPRAPSGFAFVIVSQSLLDKGASKAHPWVLM
jgi:hypothetical protein